MGGGGAWAAQSEMHSQVVRYMGGCGVAAYNTCSRG